MDTVSNKQEPINKKRGTEGTDRSNDKEFKTYKAALMSNLSGTVMAPPGTVKVPPGTVPAKPKVDTKQMTRAITFKPKNPGIQLPGKKVPFIGLGFNTHSFCSVRSFDITNLGDNRRFLSVTLMKYTINMQDPDGIKRINAIFAKYAASLPEIPNQDISDMALNDLKNDLTLEIITTAIPKCIPILQGYLNARKINDAVKEFCLFLDFMLTFSNDLVFVEVYEKNNKKVPNKVYEISKTDYTATKSIEDTVIAFDLPEIYTESKIPKVGESFIPFSWNREGWINLLGEIINYNRINPPLPGFLQTDVKYSFTTETILTYVFERGYTFAGGYDTGCNAPRTPQQPIIRSSNVNKQIGDNGNNSQKFIKVIQETREYSQLWNLLTEMHDLYPDTIPWLSGRATPQWPPKIQIKVKAGGSLNISKRSRKNTTVKRRKRKTTRRRKRLQRRSRRIRK
jgi:hypothetical protein